MSDIPNPPPGFPPYTRNPVNLQINFGLMDRQNAIARGRYLFELLTEWNNGTYRSHISVFNPPVGQVAQLEVFNNEEGFEWLGYQFFIFQGGFNVFIGANGSRSADHNDDIPMFFNWLLNTPGVPHLPAENPSPFAFTTFPAPAAAGGGGGGGGERMENTNNNNFAVLGGRRKRKTKKSKKTKKSRKNRTK